MPFLPVPFLLCHLYLCHYYLNSYRTMKLMLLCMSKTEILNAEFGFIHKYKFHIVDVATFHYSASLKLISQCNCLWFIKGKKERKKKKTLTEVNSLLYFLWMIGVLFYFYSSTLLYLYIFVHLFIYLFIYLFTAFIYSYIQI